MNRCIIKTDDRFEVSSYDGLELPVEAVMAIGETFYSVHNGIRFQWIRRSNGMRTFIISNDDITLEELNSPNIHSVADFMNKYYTLKL